MRRVAGVLIVSRLDVVTPDAARHLREQLGKLKAPVLGVVANVVSATSDPYYHGSGEAKHEAELSGSYERLAPVALPLEPNQSERLAAATGAARADGERPTERVFVDRDGRRLTLKR
jgi:Mrp family chromosome partitioning ATPase